MTDSAPATQTVTIQGNEFSIPARYAEGHTLTVNEASAMNQLFAENVRNNAASKIKKAIAEAAEAGVEFSLDAPRDGDVTLRQEIQSYAESYEFGARATRSAEPVDPIQKEAYRIAVELVNGKLRDGGIKKKDLGEGVFDDTVTKAMANEKIQKLAKKRVAEREALASEDIDVSDLVAANQSDEAEVPADESTEG